MLANDGGIQRGVALDSGNQYLILFGQREPRGVSSTILPWKLSEGKINTVLTNDSCSFYFLSPPSPKTPTHMQLAPARVDIPRIST